MQNEHYGHQNGSFLLHDKSGLIRLKEDNDPLGTRGTDLFFSNYVNKIFPDQRNAEHISRKCSVLFSAYNIFHSQAVDSY